MDSDNSDTDQMDYPNITPPPSPATSVRQRIFGKTSSKLGSLATNASLRLREMVANDVNMLKHIMPGSYSKDANTSEQSPTKSSTTNREDKSNTDTTAGKDPDTTTRSLDMDVNTGSSETELDDEEIVRHAEEDKNKKLEKILAESNEVLASATTIFPLTLFRDDIVLDRNKVTITRRNFFWSSEVMSIRIEDVLNVTSSVGPFFGSVTIAGRVLSSEDHFTVNNFWRHDAIHLKHIIQGYVIAQHNDIDCAHLPKDELIATLSKLGHDTNR